MSAFRFERARLLTAHKATGEEREAATSLSEGHTTLPSAHARFTHHMRSNFSLLMT